MAYLQKLRCLCPLYPLLLPFGYPCVIVTRMLKSIQDIAKTYKCNIIYLFGSQAEKGRQYLCAEETEPDPLSDLDIAVSFGKPPETINIYGCLYTEFSELFAPFEIDLIFIHEVDTFFHYEIIKGIRIYERSETRADEFEEDVLKRTADLSFKKKEFDKEVMEAIEDGYFQIEYSPYS